VLRVLNGRTGKEQFSVNRASVSSAGFAGISVAVGDVLGNGTVQIAAVTAEGFVVLIGSNASPPSVPLSALRTSDRPIPGSTNSLFGWGGGLAIGDMDGGGFPEIAYGATVFSTRFGGITRMWTGSGGTGGPTFPVALSVLVNLDGGPGLNLLAGNTVYRSDGTMLWRRFDLPDGFNAVADLNGDGNPEVVLVGNGQLWILDGGTGATKLGPVALPGTGLGGAPTIADFDGDGKPEIGVAMASVYSVMKPDFANSQIRVLWQNPTRDLASSVTASTAFNFDGHVDVLYADPCFLWVFDGASGAVRFAASHTTFTGTVEPVVANVDRDAHAEIVMVSTGVAPISRGCVDDTNTPVAINGVTWQPSTASDGAYRGVTVFGHRQQRWAGAPAIWNEHTFHVTNISDGTGALYPLPYGAIPRNEVPNWSVPWLNNFGQNVKAPD
jgi:hypothetical protein